MGNKKRQKGARKKAEKNKEPQQPESQEEVVDVDGLRAEQIEVWGEVDEVYKGEYDQLLKSNPDDLKGLGEIIAKRVELRRQINLLTEERERRRKEGNESVGTSTITLELIEKAVVPVSNEPETSVAGEDVETKLSEKAVVEPILNASADDRKLNISYTREFLLSLSELESCKKLPDGFNQSRWETRSSGSSDKDSDMDKDSDSFEVMKKEEHKASQEKQKLQPEKKKGDFDFSMLLDDNSKHEKTLLPTSSEIAEPLSPPASNEDADKPTLPLQTPASRRLQTPASRPLIPPGFTSKRNLGTKSLNHPHQVEPHESKADEAVRPHIVNSSKFSKWFNEAGKKPANEIAYGRPNDLFSSIVGNSQYLYKSTKPESVSAVLTCEDLERVILSEMSEGLTLRLPVQRFVVPDGKAEQPKCKVDYHASEHLLSLLQKGTGLKESKYIEPEASAVLTCQELERSIFSGMDWSAVSLNSPEPSEVPVPRKLDLRPRFIFGSQEGPPFFCRPYDMREPNILRPPFLPVNYGQYAHHHPMLQQMQMAGNFPPPHLLQGLSSAPALPPHPNRGAALPAHPVMEKMNPMPGFPFGHGMPSPGFQLFEHQGPAGSDFNPEEEEEFRRENHWAFE